MRVISVAKGGGSFATGHLARQTYLHLELASRPGIDSLSLVVNDHPVCRSYFQTTARAAGLEFGVEFTGDLPGAIKGATDGAVILLDMLELPGPVMRAAQASSASVVVFDDPRELDFEAVRVNALVPCASSATQSYEGPDYLVLHPELARLRPEADSDSVRAGVLVSFGGSDPGGLTPALLQELKHSSGRFGGEPVTVVRGGGGSQEPKPVEGVELVTSPHDFRERLAGCKLAMVTGGLTAFECAGLGTPFVGIARHDHEACNLSVLGDACVAVDASASPVTDAVKRALREARTLLEAKARRDRLSRRGMDLIDLQGAERVAELVLDLV